MPPRHQPEDGFTIIEAMFASLVLLAVATGVFTALYGGLRLQATARQRTAATAWADHLMELARNQSYDAVGLSSSGAAIEAAATAVPAGDTDNPDLLLRRDGASGCLEFNTGTAASPAWERLVVADWYTPPDAAATCATQTVNTDFHLVHAGGPNDHVAVGTPAVTYSGWVFVSWAPVDGLGNAYYKRVTVMVRFPSPTGGLSRLVRASSLFGLGYVPVPSPSSTSTSTSTTASTSTTTTTVPPTTTLPPGCVPKAGDLEGPVGSITLAGGAGYTNQTSLAINNTVSDRPNGSGASGMATMEYSNSGPGGPWLPSPATAFGEVHSGWPIAPGDGAKQVWARFTDCNGNVSPAVITDTIVLDQTRPPATVLTAAPGNRRVDLSWHAVADFGASASGVASYRVYRFDKGAATPLAVVTTTSFTDNQLTRDQAYTYWVTAVDRAGNESEESNHVTATPT
jgi:type II secretory pathway pseudopilin PulG